MKPSVTKQEELEGPAAITVDYHQFLHHLEDVDANDDEKVAYLKLLAEILIGFVDLGFGIHPVQQAQSACGKDEENPLKPALTAPDAIYLHHQQLNKNFDDAAVLESERQAERTQS